MVRSLNRMIQASMFCNGKALLLNGKKGGLLDSTIIGLSTRVDCASRLQEKRIMNKNKNQKDTVGRGAKEKKELTFVGIDQSLLLTHSHTLVLVVNAFSPWEFPSTS